MTNAELLAKIKTEIERLKGYYRITNPYDKRAIRVCENLLSFLSTLESEKPVPSDLEEAADEMAIRAFPEKKSYSTVIDRVVDYNAVDRKNYRDGIIAGAKWQAEQLLKGSPMPEDTVLFNKGVAEGKRLMMEDAIHYVVQDDLDSHGASYNIPFIRLGTVALKPKGIGVGDKVCIIIVKED